MSARADCGIIGLGWLEAGGGPLHPGDPGREPNERQTRKKIAILEKTTAECGANTCLKNQSVTFLGLLLANIQK